MPIFDYLRRAELEETSLLNNKDISRINKGHLIEFLKQYNYVKPATRHKFLSHIKYILQDTEDLIRDMFDRSKINEIFKQYYERFQSVQYSMVCSVSKQLVRWLNEGETPKGFIDVKAIKKTKRDLKPEDMWTWKEIEDLISKTNDPLLKAIISVQADAGMRASEFIDLKIEDVEFSDDLVTFTIKDGKTGARVVPCIRCTPYIANWIGNHPSKRKSEFLWVYANKGEVKRFTYGAIRKRISRLCSRHNITKPYDFYAFRHSSCYLDKMEGVSIEVASQRHGHSAQQYTETYGRLSKEDHIKRFKLDRGLKDEDNKKQIENYGHVACSRCGHVNLSREDYCFKCHAPLRVDVALKKNSETEKELAEIKEILVKYGKAISLLNKK